jgi:hypothetical protein
MLHQRPSNIICHIILYSKIFKIIDLTYIMSILNSILIVCDEMNKTRLHLYIF